MAGAAAAASGYRVNRKVAFVRWVRHTHGWFGLWGALLGLMMGVSGVWLNHRAVLKLPLPDQHRSDGRLTVPEPRPATADAMAAWLQQSLKADRPAVNVRVERGRAAPWAERGGEGRGAELSASTLPGPLLPRSSPMPDLSERLEVWTTPSFPGSPTSGDVVEITVTIWALRCSQSQLHGSIPIKPITLNPLQSRLLASPSPDPVTQCRISWSLGEQPCQG